MSYLTGTRGAGQDKTRNAIVELREHLLMLDKKEEHLSKRIEEELRKAKANAVSNKRGSSLILGQGNGVVVLSANGGWLRARQEGRQGRRTDWLAFCVFIIIQLRRLLCDRRRPTRTSLNKLVGGSLPSRRRFVHSCPLRCRSPKAKAFELPRSTQSSRPT